MCVVLAGIRHVVSFLNFVGHLDLTKQSVRVILFAKFTYFVSYVYQFTFIFIENLNLNLDCQCVIFKKPGSCHLELVRDLS